MNEMDDTGERRFLALYERVAERERLRLFQKHPEAGDVLRS